MLIDSFLHYQSSLSIAGFIPTLCIEVQLQQGEFAANWIRNLFKCIIWNNFECNLRNLL